MGVDQKPSYEGAADPKAVKNTCSDWKHTKADFDKARVGLWIELE